MLQVYFKVKANVETHKNIEWYLGSETMAPHHQFRKRKLVLAEDCAGLGSLHESCRLLGPINISNLDCELDCDLLLTKVISILAQSRVGYLGWLVWRVHFTMFPSQMRSCWTAWQLSTSLSLFQRMLPNLRDTQSEKADLVVKPNEVLMI